MFSLYDSFTIDEAANVGQRFLAKCIGNRGMERHLTTGKEYVITISPRILPVSPLCTFTGDEGKHCESHLTRFEKVEKENP